MFTRCLVCATPFPPNEALEHFPTGRRVAFDPVRGRLWAVCRSCKRWSLAPIEARWEALEELEKVVRDGARLLSQTDNIALLRAGPVEIVRVGRADLTEEAWWRYGRELTSRRRSYKKLSLAGSVAAGAVVLGGWASGAAGFVGVWWLWGNAPEAVTGAARWLRFGGAAWRGDERCARCGHAFGVVRYRDRSGVVLLPGPDARGGPDLVYPCPRCGAVREGGLRLEGARAERALRNVLAYHHYAGASENRVRSATRLIQEAGTPRDLARIVVRDGRRLGDLQRTGAIALEIASNESTEQRLLELELADLEATWAMEEELAAIVDGELTDVPLLEQVRRKVAGQGRPADASQ
ncbi:MAG: hypothetical protein KY453_00300 [Gemmatimonadetes bacterium]|nr:hypothetical protein [Gemmatimonadota bacterium]